MAAGAVKARPLDNVVIRITVREPCTVINRAVLGSYGLVTAHMDVPSVTSKNKEEWRLEKVTAIFSGELRSDNISVTFVA